MSEVDWTALEALGTVHLEGKITKGRFREFQAEMLQVASRIRSEIRAGAQEDPGEISPLGWTTQLGVDAKIGVYISQERPGFSVPIFLYSGASPTQEVLYGSDPRALNWRRDLWDAIREWKYASTERGTDAAISKVEAAIKKAILLALTLQEEEPA